MRRLATFLGALALVAGCASGAATTAGPSTTPSPVVTPATTASPVAAPAQAPSPSPTAVNARVTFDGTNCVYSGPTVIPSPALLTIEYAPTPAQEGSRVFVVAIRSDTTRADIDSTERDPNAPNVGEGAPEWADADSYHAQLGSGSNQYYLQVLRDVNGETGSTWDKYLVACLASYPGKPAPGQTILQLVETTAPSPAPTAAP